MQRFIVLASLVSGLVGGGGVVGFKLTSLRVNIINCDVHNLYTYIYIYIDMDRIY